MENPRAIEARCLPAGTLRADTYSVPHQSGAGLAAEREQRFQLRGSAEGFWVQSVVV